MATLALAAPVLGRAAAAPFVLAAIAAFVIDDGPVFELFARPIDRHEGRLAGLLGFALATTVLAVLASVPTVRMPLPVFVATVLTLAYGNLGRELAVAITDNEFSHVLGFTVVGFLAGVVGQLAVSTAAGVGIDLPLFGFLSATGVLLAALLRSILYTHDDPVVLFTVGLLLWGFAALEVGATGTRVGLALGITAALGYVSYALDTASIPGMLTGVLLGLLTIVLGGIGWFAVLISFFAIGGLATKYRYEEKRDRGVAEPNQGARGTGNVLANTAVALLAVIGVTASDVAPVEATVFALAFAGSIAGAMSDTLASEIGGLYDGARLITTLEPVQPGTDGAVTWQGGVVGVVGAVLVAGIALVGLNVTTGQALAIAIGGVIGMTADSVLGATLEGDRVGNATVNFLGTLTGAIVAVLLGGVPGVVG